MKLKNITSYQLFWGVLLGLLGFAGNWFKYELFFNVDFLFGSLFVMVALVRFGSAAGIIAGIIAAGCTLLLWNHPWAIIILTAEALFVSWRLRRSERDCLTEDIIFWLFIGAPLAWFFYYFVLHVGSQSAVLIMLKQSVNGIINALLASIIHLLIRIRGNQERDYPSFQEILFITMVTIILIPTFANLVFKLRDELTVGQKQISDAARRISLSTRSSLNQWLNLHHQFVTLLATQVGSSEKLDKAAMQRLVEQTKQRSPAFLRMGVLDRNATTIAYDPLQQNGTSNVGVNFADRPYVATLKTTLRPYIPDMVPGRLANKVPILPLLAPMIDDNGYAGYCVGITDLTQIRQLLTDHTTAGSEHITVLDRNGNVVVSTRDTLTTMQHFERPAGGTTRTISDGYSHWIPKTSKGSSIMSRWLGSLYIQEMQLSNDLPWRVLVEISPKAMLTKLSASSINSFLMMMTIIVLSSLFARFISSRYVRSLQLLQQETRHIPEVLEDRPFAMAINTSRIKELYGLTENFRQMARTLRTRMQEVRSADQLRLHSIETERQHLCEKEMLVRDLHDGIGGLITRISMLAQYAVAHKSAQTYAENMDKILELAYEGGVEIRSFMNSLESDQPAWSDLLAEITEHCERMFHPQETTLTVSSSISPDAAGAGVFSYVNIVRIFREAIANIVKHAAARSVQVTLNVTAELFTLTIADDGVGYDVTSVHKRGVANMYNRAELLAAQLTVESRANGGTRIVLAMPLTTPQEEPPCVLQS